jgi:hypothetical protein
MPRRRDVVDVENLCTAFAPSPPFNFFAPPWLRAMPDSDAGVLQAAYEPRPWPRRVRQEFKWLTGIAVRLTTDPATWPEKRELQLAEDAENAKILDEVCADRGPKQVALLQDLRRLAEARLAGAVRRYVEVRGPGPCIVRQP